MNIKTKMLLTKTTTSIIILTTLFILVWFIGSIISTTFNLSVFNEKSIVFLASSLGGAFVLIMCSAILNVVINISIIAEKNIDTSEKISTKINYLKIFLAFILGVFVIAAFLFSGDYISKEKEKSSLIKEAKDVMARYSNSINTIKNDPLSKDVPTTLGFLSSIKEQFQYVTLITNEKYNNDNTYIETTKNTVIDKNLPLLGRSFYKCSTVDCDYISKVFLNNKKEEYFYKSGDILNLYIPYFENEKVFILLFSKYNRYGSVSM